MKIYEFKSYCVAVNRFLVYAVYEFSAYIEHRSLEVDVMSKGIANLGETIRSLRLSRGMEQKELAGYTGMTQSHLSKIETGKANPSLKKLKKVAEVLGVSEKVFFRGSCRELSLGQNDAVFEYLDEELQEFVMKEESIPSLEFAKEIHEIGFTRTELEALKLVFKSRQKPS